jgi:hypothetical protein
MRHEFGFKSAADLGITEKERTALATVLGLLEGGQIGDNRNSLQMRTPCVGNSCGTVACIGGWTSVFMQGGKLGPDGYYAGYSPSAAEKYVISYHPCKRSLDLSEELSWLYYPYSHGKKSYVREAEDDYKIMMSVTPEQAAIGLRNYLETGSPQWDKFLPILSIQNSSSSTP